MMLPVSSAYRPVSMPVRRPALAFGSSGGGGASKGPSAASPSPDEPNGLPDVALLYRRIQGIRKGYGPPLYVPELEQLLQTNTILLHPHQPVSPANVNGGSTLLMRNEDGDFLISDRRHPWWASGQTAPKAVELSNYVVDGQTGSIRSVSRVRQDTRQPSRQPDKPLRPLPLARLLKPMGYYEPVAFRLERLARFAKQVLKLQ